MSSASSDGPEIAAPPGGDRANNGLNQAQLLAIINPSWENARVWGAVYSHRQACVRYLRDRVLSMLEDPAMTRSRLRRELLALAKQVEELGPPEAGA